MCVCVCVCVVNALFLEEIVKPGRNYLYTGI